MNRWMIDGGAGLRETRHRFAASDIVTGNGLPGVAVGYTAPTSRRKDNWT